MPRGIAGAENTGYTHGMELRAYQQHDIEAIRAAFASGSRRVCYVLPTGGGKGVVGPYIGAGVAQKNKRALFIAHREELLDQLSESLKEFNVDHGMMFGASKGTPRTNVIVGSIGKTFNRLKYLQPPDLIFVDECHHSPAKQYKAILNYFPNAKVLGLTATPQRLDGKGLSECFDSMVIGPSVSELIVEGHLVPCEIYSTPLVPNLTGVHTRAGDYVASELTDAMDKPSITGDAVEHYRKLAHKKAAVVFCCSVKHAYDVAESFCAAGYKFVALEAKTDKDVRRRAIYDLKEGNIDGITNADLIGEGVNIPRIEVIVLLRPTKSLGVAMQQIGRGLRPSVGKDRCIILDHAGVIKEHGFPDDERKWSLEGIDKRVSSGDSAPAVRVCPECFACHKPQPTCPRCNHVYVVNSRTVEHIDGELTRVSSVDDYKVEVPNAVGELERTFFILRNMARKRGKKFEEASKWAFAIVSQKLAQKLAKQREAGGTNGLYATELAALKERTIERNADNDGVL